METTTAAAPNRGREHALAGIFSNAVALVTGQAATGAFLVIVARRTDPELFGVFAAVYAASLVFGGMLDFGSSQLMTRRLARNEGRDDFRAWLTKRTFLQLPFAVAIAVAMGFLGAPKVGFAVALVTGLQTITYPIGQGASAAVRALRSPALAAWFAVAGNVCMLVAVIAAPSTAVLEAAAIGAAGSWLLTATAGLASTRRLVGTGSIREVGHPWQGSLPFGVAGLAYASPGLHFTLIAAGAGAAQAGLAAAVQKWTQPIQLLPNAFATQLFPAFAAAPTHRAALRLMRPLGVVAVLGAIGAVIMIAVAPQLTTALLGEEYAGAAPVLRLYALAAIPILVGQPLSAYLQARGDEHAVAAMSVTMSIVTLAAVLALAPSLGAKAAPLASAGAWVALVAIYWRRVVSLIGSESGG